MSLVRMNIESVVVGAGPVASMVVLKPKHGQASSTKLPIRIGSVEAVAISMGVEGSKNARPLTHDLLRNVIDALGARVCMRTAAGEAVTVDARPSDALSLAVRAHVPIYADELVLSTAALPDFAAVERDERERERQAFHDFVENLSPEDFA